MLFPVLVPGVLILNLVGAEATGLVTCRVVAGLGVPTPNLRFTTSHLKDVFAPSVTLSTLYCTSPACPATVSCCTVASSGFRGTIIDEGVYGAPSTVLPV